MFVILQFQGYKQVLLIVIELYFNPLHLQIPYHNSVIYTLNMFFLFISYLSTLSSVGIVYKRLKTAGQIALIPIFCTFYCHERLKKK